MGGCNSHPQPCTAVRPQPGGFDPESGTPPPGLLMTERITRLMLWTVAVSVIGIFVVLATRRIPYPLELDYIEGAMMDHIVRLSQGRPIYVAPSLDFITLAYMPGYATLVSLLARVNGPALWEPRLVSFTAMMINAFLVGFVLRRETRSWTLAIAGAGLLIGAFGVTGAHYDVGRPDSLMLCLVLSGLVVLRFTSGLRGAAVSALLLTLAFFTKQHAAWFVLAAMVHLAVNDRLRFWLFSALAIAGCVGGYLALTLWLGPWFPFFTWEIPSHWSQLDKVRILNYFGRGLVGTFGYLTAGVLASLALPDRLWTGRGGLWYWVGLGGLATGIMATLDPDAFRHVMNPSVVALSVLGPLAWWHVTHHLATWPGSTRTGRHAVLWLILALQFVPLAYTVRGQLPHQHALAARRELVERIQAYPGRVLMLYHGYYTWLAGKGSTLQQIALDDIIRARGNRLLRQDPGAVERILAPLMSGTDRPMIITDIALERSGIESQPLWAKVARGYRYAGDLRPWGGTLDPVDGNHWTPRYVYLPAGAGDTTAVAGAPGAAGAIADSTSAMMP